MEREGGGKGGEVDGRVRLLQSATLPGGVRMLMTGRVFVLWACMVVVLHTGGRPPPPASVGSGCLARGWGCPQAIAACRGVLLPCHLPDLP